MNTQEQTINNVVTQLILSSSPNKYPKKDKEYRYYHCNLDWNRLKCIKVDGPNTIPSRNDSLLLSIKSYIPEYFDKYVLKYKWIPDRVIIEEKST